MNKHLERNNCIICGKIKLKDFLKLKFSEKNYLPKSITIKYCDNCDFAFTSPASQDLYTKYYNNTNNDLIHTEVNNEDSNLVANIQSENFNSILKKSKNLNILDYGCGGGDLLSLLSKTFSQHNFLGYDVNIEVGNRFTKSNISKNCTFINSLDNISENFDLIILSHVLEHIVDLNFIIELKKYLTTKGKIYIEIPNPNEYTNNTKREFLYYFDRLHVNHFSLKSLNILFNNYGFKIVEYGNHMLPYKDGNTYPAQYCFLENILDNNYSLEFEFYEYLKLEEYKLTELSNLPSEEPILVYGFGDNFFRCINEGGPLYNRNILAIIDKRAEVLKNIIGNEYNFITLEDVFNQFKNTAIVITVSWGSEEIKEKISKYTNSKIYII